MNNDVKALALRIGLIAVFILSGYLILMVIFKYAGPFIVAFAAALLIEPLVSLMSDKLKLSRAISSLVVVLLVLAIIGVAISFGISAIISEINSLINVLPLYYTSIQTWFMNTMDNLRHWYGKLSPETVNIVNQVLSRLYQWMEQLLQVVMNWIIQMFNAVPSATLFIVFTILATYIISKDKHIIGQTLMKVLPIQWRQRVYRLKSDVLSSAWRLLWTQVLLVLISTAITMAGFFILNIKYAVLLGIISGLLDILPIVGPTLLFIPWIIYCFFTGHIWLGIGLAILYAIMSVTRQVLQAKLVSDNVGLHPLITLLALYIGMQIFGFIGVIIGPLIALIIVQAIKNGLFTWEKA